LGNNKRTIRARYCASTTWTNPQILGTIVALKLPASGRDGEQQAEGDQMNPAEAPTNPNKALWEKGDFTQIAGFMRKSGEALADSLKATPTM
jgi:hypothetical protein